MHWAAGDICSSRYVIEGVDDPGCSSKISYSLFEVSIGSQGMHTCP